MGESIERQGAFILPKPGAGRRRLVEALLSLLLITLGPSLDSAKIVKGMGAVAILLAGLVIGGVMLARLMRDARFRPGPVRVSAEGVRLGDTLIPRRSIKSAWFAPGAGQLQSSVRLVGADERVVGQIEVNGPADARRILDALALGPKETAARFSAFAPRGSAAHGAAWIAFGVGLLPMLGMFLLGAPGLVVLSVILWILGSATFLPCSIHVGADGLLIATRIAPIFVPWSEVAEVGATKGGVLVRRKTGRSITIPTTPPGKFTNDYDRVIQQGLIERASEALAAYRRGEQPDVAARVARRGRPHAEWVRDLFDREGSFREAPVLDDQLWTVVESPTAEPSARAGAAAVLARNAGEAERSRLRVAADACTAPRLRVVLDRTATGASDAAIEEALRAIEDESSIGEAARR